MWVSFLKDLSGNEVDSILGKRECDGEREFLIKWTDHWVAESDLECPDLLQKFLDSSKIFKAKYQVSEENGLVKSCVFSFCLWFYFSFQDVVQ
jgi:hypothetical protein